MKHTTVTGSVFKAYDIRGIVGEELNPHVAYLIGRAFVALSGAKTVATGRDVRQSSHDLQAALNRGLVDGGAAVLDVGLCGTEVVSFAGFHQGLDGAIMVTASHNPMAYNGMKVMGPNAATLTSPCTLPDLRDWCIAHQTTPPAAVATPGMVQPLDILPTYRDFMLNLVDTQALQPLKVVVNPGNGCGQVLLDQLLPALPQLEVIKINYMPDATFPNGIPNPMLPETQQQTTQAVLAHQADLGIAWDGDCDRCFLFDHTGQCVSPYQLGTVLAAATVQRHPGATIMHDPRLEWNLRQTVQALGGRLVRQRAGYTFFKEKMAQENVRFGAEASGHFFYQEFGNCDTGMLTWLRVLELMVRTGKTLQELVAEHTQHAWAIAEINRTLSRPAGEIIQAIQSHYTPLAVETNTLDGFSATFNAVGGQWRMNLRMSNTEPLVRLNLEATSPELRDAQTHEVLAAIDAANQIAAAA